MSYILEEFVINDHLKNIHENLHKKEELFEIIKRLEYNYSLIHSNINKMNNLIRDKINILKLEEFISKEEKEYNKIMNEIYKFNVDK